MKLVTNPAERREQARIATSKWYSAQTPEMRRARFKKWYDANKEKARARNRERQRAWRIANPEKARAYYHDKVKSDEAASERHRQRSKARYYSKKAEIAAKGRIAHRKRKYGLTQEAYEFLLQSQGGKCAICRCDEPGTRSGEWDTDHCHVTGVVRGLLCRGCNVGLGAFKDGESVLAAAAHYVMRHKTRVA